MTTEQQELPGLGALDDRPGPALPLPLVAAAAQADALVARLQAPRRIERIGRRTQAGIFISVVTVATLALLYRSREPQTHPVREAASRTGETAPALVAPQAPVLVERIESPTQPRDFLGLANAARAQRDFARAEQLYMRVVGLYPSSDDAAAARLAAADLQAQQLGRAREAVALYRELIAMWPNGALVEQARAGLARAYFVLGDRAQEQQAWRELLRASPRSLFAQEARARLKAR